MKAYIACIQKLNDLVSETTITNKEKFVACPSLRMFEADDFKFSSGENLVHEDFLKSEDLSLQLNSLSSIENYWDIDPNNNLFDQFKSRVTDLQTKNKSSITKSVEKDIQLLYNSDETETELLEKYNEKMMEYDELVMEYEDITSTYHEDLTENEKTVINQKLDILTKKIALQFARWELNSVKSTVENALENINHLNDYDLFLNKLKEIKGALMNSEFTGLQSNNTYSKLQIIPFDFYENDNSWSSIEITNEEFNSLFNKAKQTLKGFNESMLEFDYQEDFIEKITLNYCIVNIKRKWLIPSVFDNEFIKQTTPLKPFTYAKKVILVKDLRVILKEDLSQNEKTEIEKNSVIKFGPIFMKNQFFMNKRSNKAFIKPITRKKITKRKTFKKVDMTIARVNPKAIMMNPKAMALKPKDKTVNPRARVAKPKDKIRGRRAVNPHLLRVNPRARVHIKDTQKPILKLNSRKALIHKIDWKKVATNKQSNIHFNLKDVHSDEEIYKAEISIQNRNSNLFKEVETDENGTIKVTLPKGSYDISIIKNGYKELNFMQTVAENRNVNLVKKMEPQEVVYDSYFLMGIIGETINL